MNNDRRKIIRKIIATLDEVKSDIETVGEEERDYFDNMPENFQDSERGERADEAATELEDLASEFDDITDRLLGIIEG